MQDSQQSIGYSIGEQLCPLFSLLPKHAKFDAGTSIASGDSKKLIE